MFKDTFRPGYGKKRPTKYMKDLKISTSPTFKTTCQGDRTSGIFLPGLKNCVSES